MLVSQNDIKNRIEELKLSLSGYSRQLQRLDISDERRERLGTDIVLLQEEVNALEALAQLGRVEPDRENVEAVVRQRIDSLHAESAGDAGLNALNEEERDQTSGEARALLWAVGEDRLTRNSRFLVEGREHSDPTRTDRAVPGILIHTLQEAPSPEARASAAYELGQLHITQAIPDLAAALEDEPEVAEFALLALARFTSDQLREAGVSSELVEKIHKAKA